MESENSNQSELTYAKEVLNQVSNETKILGLDWNKQNDTLTLVTPTSKKNHQLTKRNILSELASAYDPTGVISRAHLIGKILYREICESRISWDESLPQTIKLKWEKWKLDIVNKVEIPRSLTLEQEPSNSVDLHIFRDASIPGYCAVAYAVVSQPSKVNQGLVASKSRLWKKGITIPRLELIATHGSKYSHKHQGSSKRSEHHICYRMGRQYCCFTLVERSRKLQSICSEQSYKDLES